MNDRLPRLLLTCALLLPGLGVLAEDAEIVRMANQVCASCHGPHGDSISPAFPRLSGQNAAYIEAQLKAFKDQARGDPYAQAYMWGMVSQLDEDTMKRLADYYAAQKPHHGQTGEPALMAEGRRIFENGVADSGISPCASCHGANAQGKDTIPRLAGQHPEYLVKQLAAFKSLQRGNAPVMHVMTQNMTLDQMRAVAQYAASK
jgi:cytochrome c553